MDNMGAVILTKVKKQVAKMFQTESKNVWFDKRGSHDNYIHLEVDEEHEVRVEMDLEDNDWWVEVKKDGVWKREDIITI